MQAVGYGILIGLLVIIGFIFGKMVIENRKIKEDYEDMCDTRYSEVRYLILMSPESPYMRHLVSTVINGHAIAGYEIKKKKQEGGCEKYIFENGDEMWLFYDMAAIKPLSQHQATQWFNRILIDYKLPIGAERAFIHQLGLDDFLIQLGVCTEKSGGEK